MIKKRGGGLPNHFLLRSYCAIEKSRGGAPQPSFKIDFLIRVVGLLGKVDGSSPIVCVIDVLLNSY